MKKKNKISVVRQVNRVYAKLNPSFYLKNLNNKSEVIKFYNNRRNFYLKLKITDKLLKDSTLLDLGSGAGQNSLSFSIMGAKCTLVDYDKFSCQQANIIFKKYSKKKFKIINKDIFKFKSNKKFDFVVSNGVAHHTKDSYKNLEIACDFVKEKGFIIFGIANQSGMFQRNLMRLILFNICEDEKEIYAKAKILFKESISRSIKFSGRSADEIIADTFVNPKFAAIDVKSIFRIFSEHNITLYSAYPDVKNIENFLGLNETQFKLLNNKSKQFHNIVKRQNEVYLHDFQSLSLNTNISHLGEYFSKIKKLDKIRDYTSRIVNDKNFKNYNVNLSKLVSNMRQLDHKISNLEKISILDKKHNKRFFKEAINIIKIINEKKDNEEKFLKLKKYISKTRYIFKGYNGVGMNYYVGYKLGKNDFI